MPSGERRSGVRGYIYSELPSAKLLWKDIPENQIPEIRAIIDTIPDMSNSALGQHLGAMGMFHVPIREALIFEAAQRLRWLDEKK